MANAGDGVYVTVNDRKTPRDDGYRLAILNASQTGRLVVTPLPVHGLAAVEQPSDLESICAVPGRRGEYLAAESGFFKGDFGRLFHFRLRDEESRGWHVELLNERLLRDEPMTKDNSTPKFDEIEGLVCFEHQDHLLIAYCERGHGDVRGEIHWGRLERSTLAFDHQGSAPLVPPPSSDNRDCSELHIDSRTESSVSLIAVATYDEDDDDGPFRSMVYRAGRLVLDTTSGNWRYAALEQATLYEIEGLKIEALADGPPGRSQYSVGTDDENLGGVWRPLGAVNPSQ